MKKWNAVWLLLMFLLLAGCAQNTEEESVYKLYYVNYDEAIIEESVYEPKSEDTEAMIKEMVDMLSGETDESEKLLPEGMEILNYEISNDVLILNFNKAYQAQDPVDEILFRAASVKNFIQIPDIYYVQFMIEGADFLDSRGEIVGRMSGDSFLENSGKDITAYQYTQLELYFANQAGDGLVKEKRNVYYSSNSPIEKVVVEQLIRGPKEEDAYATLSPNIKILGVTVSDGIAYVNLDEKFTAETMAINEELPIYSIVNSLVAAGNVSQVQISVNGDTKLTFREDMPLDKMYQENMELLEDGGGK